MSVTEVLFGSSNRWRSLSYGESTAALLLPIAGKFQGISEIFGRMNARLSLNSNRTIIFQSYGQSYYS
jgi:hypothetical protein